MTKYLCLVQTQQSGYFYVVYVTPQLDVTILWIDLYDTIVIPYIGKYCPFVVLQFIDVCLKF